jgi:hypothetical protein
LASYKTLAHFVHVTAWQPAAEIAIDCVKPWMFCGATLNKYGDIRALNRTYRDIVGLRSVEVAGVEVELAKAAVFT